ncbi:tRNA (guanine-N(7)-)-methyltransferase [Geobacillus sp. BCO2]|nr:tRNA (guanine-N(7)-)-methyltransferase [Geobacillus sp. BCO2]
MNANAKDLTAFFADGEVSRLYLNFSDPWPKKRHEKRRLTHRGFLALYDRILAEDGDIHLKTDNQSFFEYSLVSLSQYGFVLASVQLDLHQSGIADNVMTEYEEKFSAKGNRIYRCEAVRPLRQSS